MGRKGESIFKRKDGRYEGRYIKGYNELGKAIYGYVYAKSYSECKRKRTEFLLKKELKVTNFQEIRNIELDVLIDNWLLSKKDKIKESSYSRYYQLINTHIRTEIGKIKVNQLNEKVVNDYVKSKLANGKLNCLGGLSQNTVYDIILILKQVFKTNSIPIKIMTISKSTGSGKTFYKEEKSNLEDYLIHINNKDTMGILLSLFLGLREGEICGLKWKDIDLNNKVIHIRRTISRVKSFDTKSKTKVIITSPKSKNSIRDLPIPIKLFDALSTLKLDNKEENYLLTGTKKYMDPRTYYNHYKKILNQISISNHTYHDLRHTFATSCIEIGIDAKTLMELLGHSNVTTTLNIYVHSSLENKRNFIDQL